MSFPPSRLSEATPPYEDWTGALLQWYDQHHRPLPWRDTTDPWSILISEVMAQQTRVEVVIPYYHRFLQRFPTFSAAAAAPMEEVLALWSGLGYYRRARALHQCAQELERLGGFPEDFGRLPGVGPYTAAALASIAFARPAVALDGNALRVYSRYYAVDLQTTAATQDLRRRVLPLIPPTRPGDFNQAIMELGATLCLPRNPRCQACPLAFGCQARQQGRVDQLPLKRPPGRQEKMEMQALVLVRPPRVWLTREHGQPFLKGLWLPLLGPRGTPPEGGTAVGTVRHGITYRDLHILVYRQDNPIDPPGSGAWLDWTSGQHAIPNLTRKILERC